MTASDPRVWVAEARTRAEKASRGPWDVDAKLDARIVWSDGLAGATVARTHTAGDAAFIAAARTDLPRALDALQAVLDLCDVMDGWGGASAQNAARVRHAITASLEVAP